MALMTQVGLEFIARNRANRQINSFNRNIRRMGRQMLAIAGVGGGMYAIHRGFSSIIKAASDAEETQAKFNTVFRGMSEEANKWAESFGQEVGRSKQSVKSWMAGLQDTFVPLGIARDEALKLAQGLTTLAVDVASFNNAADADVIRDFTSALVGNHETVRKFGIIISESAIKQEAYRQGIEKTYKELTDLEKVQLRYSLIQRGTTDAQGDAIRTSGSYANQVKRLSANWDNFKVMLGQEILPALTELIKSINENEEAIEKFGEALKYLPAYWISIQIEVNKTAIAIWKVIDAASNLDKLFVLLGAKGELWKDTIVRLQKENEELTKKMESLISSSVAAATTKPALPAGKPDFMTTFPPIKRFEEPEWLKTMLFRLPPIEEVTAEQRKAAEEIDKVQTEMWLKQAEKQYHAMRAPIIKLEKEQTEAWERSKRIHEDIARGMAGEFSNTIDSMIFEGKRFCDAMTDMLRSVLRMIIQIMTYEMIAKPLAYGIMGRPVPEAQAGGYVERGGLAKIHTGETIIPKNQVGGGDTHVHIHNEQGEDREISRVEQYIISDQRIIDVFTRRAQTDGPLRRSIKQATR